MQSFNSKYPHPSPPSSVVIQKSFSSNTVHQRLSLINRIPVQLPLALGHVQVTRNLQKSSLLAIIKEEMDSGKARLLSEADTEFARVHSRGFYAVINEEPITETDTVWILIMWIFGRPEWFWRRRQRLNGSQTAAGGFWDWVMQNCNQSLSSTTYQSIFLSQQIPILHPWLSVMSCQPPHSPSVVQNSFLEACVFLFFIRKDRLQQITWLILHGWMGKPLSGPHLIPATLTVFKEFSSTKGEAT